MKLRPVAVSGLGAYAGVNCKSYQQAGRASFKSMRQIIDMDNKRKHPKLFQQFENDARHIGGKYFINYQGVELWADCPADLFKMMLNHSQVPQ